MCKNCVGLIVLVFVLGLAQASLAAWDPNTDPSLVGWWKLDEKSGSTAADSSTNRNNGAVSGDAVWAAGRIDGCLQLDGSNDYVSLPIGSVMQTLNSATFAGWAKWSQQGGSWQRIFDMGTGTTVNMFLTPSNGSTTGMRFAITTSGNGAESQLTATNRLATGWHHVAVVINGDTRAMQLYLDAAVVASGTTNTLPKDLGNTTQNWLGRSQYSADAYYNGSLDDFRIYSRALSAEEVRALVPPILKATNPTPANGATGVGAPALTWTPGETAMFVDIYVGTTPDLTTANRVKRQSAAVKMLYVLVPPLEPGQTYYWRVDSLDAKSKLIAQGDVWSFTMAPVTAFAPIPADGALYQSVDADLAWSAGQDAFSHEVYFSTNQDDVANRAEAAFQGLLVQSLLELPPLALETTYYWCVDEIDALGDKHVGNVWSFTTTIPGLGAAKRELWLNGSSGTAVADLTNDARYPGNPTDVNEMPDFESPSNIADNYGGKLSAWLHVPLAGEYTFWVASDDNSELWLGADADSAELIASVDDWTDAQQWDKFPSQKSEPITLEAGRYFLMALWKDGTGGDNCAAAWQGAGIPARTLIAGNYLMPFEALWAYGPRPRNNDVNTPQILEMKWTAGTRATTHQVYFSEDKDAVANGEPGSAAYRGQQAVDSTTFNPGNLEFGKTYYWRVDEVNPAEADSPWKGAVWTFTTANFIVVDGFEDYVDDVEGRIFQTWIDGWGYSEPAPGNPGNGTGSAVGYGSAPFAERTIVKSGVQSMPFAYNNADSP
ncbi:MAG: hypothetical protein JW955_24905, partial [Sedimentisphaerales bacterium]|nr:hypothetical protein [Sedimentisphaerales bacterium]